VKLWMLRCIVLDHGRRPHGGDDFIARHKLPGVRNQHAENVERARADRHRNKDAALVAPGKATGAPIEAETIEKKSIFRNEKLALERRPR
jgi:hypothetical protein